MIDFNNNFIISYPNNRFEYWYSSKVFYLRNQKAKNYSFRQAKNLNIWDRIIFKVEEFNTTQVDLRRDLNQIFSGYNSTTRNEIRKCDKLQIKFKQIHDLEDFTNSVGIDIAESYDFVKNELGRAFRIFISYSEYELEMRWYSLHILVTRGKWMRLLISERNKFEDKNIVGYANRGLHNFTIMYAKNCGFEIYDFGGIAKNTDDPKKIGINKFKMAFGGEIACYYNLKPYHLLQRLINKMNAGFNYKKFQSNYNGIDLPFKAEIIDDLAIEGVWRGSPSGGRYLLRYLHELKQKVDYSEKRILDIGCSEGQALKMLSDLGCKDLGGVEIRKELYDVCSKNMKALDIKVDLYNSDVRYFDELYKFDCIYMYNPFSIDILNDFIDKIIKIKKQILFIYVNSVHENYFFSLQNIEIKVIDRSVDIWGNNILVFEFIPVE